MPGQRAGFGDHSFHHIAVTGQHIGEVIDYFISFAVETRGQVSLGNCHAYGIGQTLTQRARGYFRTGGVPVFGVPRCAAVPLAKIFNIVQRQVVTG